MQTQACYKSTILFRSYVSLIRHNLLNMTAYEPGQFGVYAWEKESLYSGELVRYNVSQIKDQIH